jgi:hypothetical protein
MQARECNQHVWTIVRWWGDDGHVMIEERICFRCAMRGLLPANQNKKADSR